MGFCCLKTSEIMMLLSWGSFSPFSRRHDPKNGFGALDVSLFCLAFGVLGFCFVFRCARFPDDRGVLISGMKFFLRKSLGFNLDVVELWLESENSMLKHTQILSMSYHKTPTNKLHKGAESPLISFSINLTQLSAVHQPGRPSQFLRWWNCN